MIYGERKPFDDSGTRSFIVITTSVVRLLGDTQGNDVSNQFKEEMFNSSILPMIGQGQY